MRSSVAVELLGPAAVMLITPPRGSGLSNTTQATSTDNSSRHSNASTAPSSADMHGNSSPVEARYANKAPPEMDGPARGPSTKSISASLFKGPRTWSFGGQKKQSVPPPRDEPAVPDLPPMLTIQTGSASVPTEPVKSPPGSASAEEKKALDLGGDFGAMFSNRGLDTVNETASNSRSLTGNRMMTMPTSVSEPMLRSDSDGRTATGLSRYPSDHKKSTPSPVEDEDAKLLRDSFAAMKFLNHPHVDNGVSATEAFYNRQVRDDLMDRKPVTIADSFAKDKEENMFEGRTTQFAKNSQRYVTQRTAHPPRNKVMTPAQFEKYRQDKERQGLTEKSTGPLQGTGRALPAVPTQDEDEDDDINYEDDEDEAEKSRQQVKQRRKQEAHMAVYRQQMMKVTGEHAAPAIPSPRPPLPSTMSAPQLSTMKTPSPKLPPGGSDEDEDEEVPLAILQAHGFPTKSRAPTRLSMSGSNPNLHSSYQPSLSRPQSVMGDAGPNAARRASTLPAFARNLPQDPFVGASIARPAIRESLSFHESGRNSGLLPPGGLVGVIANEERSRAMRRGSPNIDAGKPLPPNMYQRQPGPAGYDPVAGIPHQMMYGKSGMGAMGMGGGQMMPDMQPPGMSPGEQAQQQITQQMQQFMQMQMQFMQMMAMNQSQQHPQNMSNMPNNPYPMQQPGGIAATQSMTNLSLRHSVLGMEAMPGPHEPNVRTMSMIQPPFIPMAPHPGYAGSVHGSIGGGMGIGIGYAPSIAPSERSNIGLPGRYRPVSHAAVPSPKPSQYSDPASTLSGGLNNSETYKGHSSLNMSRKVSDGSDDDDESGWTAMKAKRDKKRTFWRGKKSPSTDLTSEQLAGI